MLKLIGKKILTILRLKNFVYLNLCSCNCIFNQNGKLCGYDQIAISEASWLVSTVFSKKINLGSAGQRLPFILSIERLSSCLYGHLVVIILWTYAFFFMIWKIGRVLQMAVHFSTCPPVEKQRKMVLYIIIWIAVFHNFWNICPLITTG